MNSLEEQLLKAIIDRNLDMFQALVNAVRANGWPPGPRELKPLHQICEWDWLDGLKVALTLPEAAEMLNEFDDFSRTPLIFAVQQDSPETVALLLGAGADINARDEAAAGNTALIEAVDAGKPRLVEQLLRAGADPTIPGWMGTTAADKARRQWQKDPTPDHQRIQELITAPRR